MGAEDQRRCFLSGGDWPEWPSPRFIFHRIFRQKDLCPTPRYCPEVLNLDPYADASALPCDGCPLQRLHSYLASPGGRLIQVVIDLDFALQVGVTVRLADISYPEFLLLRQFAEERTKHEVEQIEKKSKKR